ncbi:MAG: peptide chain release factor N(5)-glutamine methyltransferase [Deltaproteobacteria bacterium]|nr:peptide chain release factor N(5)-glutamine methyltransferase [Deltaproteobacteria bacterium]
MSERKTVLELLALTADYFKKNGVEAPRLEAELLLAKALGCDRVALYVRYDKPLGDAEVAAYRALVARRAKQEPVHYILGEREFWSLAFEVGKGVLIPRPDTEVLVEEILRLVADRKDEPLAVADVGTGTGCLAVTLARELPHARVVAGDIADVPLALAQRNAERHGVADRVRVVRADGLAPLVAIGGPFDVVVSNPPYIPEADFARLPPHVRQEPREALIAGQDGLDVLRRIVADAPRALVPGGIVALEVGDRAQADAVVALFREVGAHDVHVRSDYAGDPRGVVARFPKTS